MWNHRLNMITNIRQHQTTIKTTSSCSTTRSIRTSLKTDHVQHCETYATTKPLEYMSPTTFDIHAMLLLIWFGCWSAIVLGIRRVEHVHSHPKENPPTRLSDKRAEPPRPLTLEDGITCRETKYMKLIPTHSSADSLNFERDRTYST